MPAAHVAERAESFSNTDGTSFAIALTSAGAITVGNHLILCFVNQSNVAVTSITDPRSNAWQIDVGVANTTIVTVTIASCKVANAYTNGDSITVNLASTATAAVWGIEEFSGLDATTWLDKTATNAGGVGTTRDSGTTATLAQAAELGVAAFALGNTASADTPTYDADWTRTVSDLRSTVPFRCLNSAYKVLSATTAEQWGATGGVSVANCGVIATYKAATATTHTGSAALGVTVGVATAGVAIRRSSVALPFTASAGTAGYALKRSTVALPETLAVATAASQVKHATSTLPVTFGAATAGYALKRAASALPLTLSIGTAGSELAKMGSVSLQIIAFGYGSGGFGGENYGSGVQGYAIKRAAAALPVSLAIGTAGGRKSVSSVALPLTLATATNGIVRAYKSGSVSLTVAFGVASSGTKTTKSAVALPLTIAIATNGTLQAFVTGSASLPVTFGAATNGVRTTTSSLALPLTLGVATSAWTPRRGQASLNLVLTIVVNTGVFAYIEPIETGHIGYAGRGRIEGAERGVLVR